MSYLLQNRRFCLAISLTTLLFIPSCARPVLSSEDRNLIINRVRVQVQACLILPDTPKKQPILPLVRIQLNVDGSLDGDPVIMNASDDPEFQKIAASGIRAIRQCAPYRIPARFKPMHHQWRNIIIQLTP
ncbi:MAG: cell envelope integrity protein TolA [Beijerinckiaceae bacterium]